MLAVVFACQRFHQNIYEKKVQTESEYRPLGPITKKAMIVNDVSNFKKELKYISGRGNILAGNLSCASLKETIKDVAE